MNNDEIILIFMYRKKTFIPMARKKFHHFGIPAKNKIPTCIQEYVFM